MDRKEKERKKQYYLDNIDRIKENQKEYRANNRDKLNEISKKYKLKNRDKISEIGKKYYREHPEKCGRLYYVIWNNNNPDNLISVGDGDCIHHIDHDHYNNSPDNLIKMGRGDHQTLHNNHRHQNKQN